MKEALIYTSDPDLIRQYIRKGYKVVSIGYFPNSCHPVYHYTLKKPEKK